MKFRHVIVISIALLAVLTLSCAVQAPISTPTPPPTPEPVPSLTPATPSPLPTPTSLLPLIDAHGHIIPNLAAETIISIMDQAGIQKMVLMFNRPPNDWPMGREDAIVLEAYEKYPQRIIPFLLAANRLRWHYPLFESYVESQLKTGKFKGMGEFMVKHYACPPPDTAPAITIPADSPYMLNMMRLGAKYNVPLNIHMETTPETLAELDRALLANKDTKVIWAHQNPVKMGGGPEAQYARKGDPDQIAALMDKHPNLYADISAGYESLFCDWKGRDRQLPERWKNLYEKYNDRFVAAIDSPTRTVWEKGILSRANWNRNWLSQLSPGTAKKLAYENIERILSAEPPKDHL